jgi:hypothetical protein
MAKITRVLAKIFGTGAGTDQRSVFGSLFAGAPAFSTDPELIQSLSNWEDGWFSAAIGGNAPAIEDMNSALFVLAYQIAYQMQAGVPEWNTDTVYYIGSLANSATGVTYVSRTDDNQGNALSDTANWKVVGGNILTDLGDLLYAGADGDATRLAGNITTVKKVLTQVGTGTASAAPVWGTLPPPTMTRITASGTYTLPAGCLYIKVKLAGAGGGGAGCGTSNTGGAGGSGGNSTFGGTLLVANGGTGGNLYDPGVGGTSSISSPAYGSNLTGCSGDPSGFNGNISLNNQAYVPGGAGGLSGFLGAGKGASGNQAGGNAAANSGAGGGGGFSATNASTNGGGGGGGGYVEAVIPSPSATYAVVIGAKGTGGTAGTSGFAGGDGGDGVCEVWEFYQ